MKPYDRWRVGDTAYFFGVMAQMLCRRGVAVLAGPAPGVVVEQAVVKRKRGRPRKRIETSLSARGALNEPV